MGYDPYVWIDPYEEIAKRSAEASRSGYKHGFSDGTQAVRDNGAEMVRAIVEEKLLPLKDYPSAVGPLVGAMEYDQMMSPVNPDQMTIEVGLMQPFRYTIRMRLPRLDRA